MSINISKALCYADSFVNILSDEFLRDGQMLAARMTGTIKVDGADTAFESSMFAKLDSSGRMEWLKERSVWGHADAAPDKGTGLHAGMSAHD